MLVNAATFSYWFEVPEIIDTDKKQEKIDRVEDLYLKAISIDSTFIKAYFGLGNFYTHEGRYEEAYSMLKISKSIRPNHRENTKITIAISNGYYLIGKEEYEAGQSDSALFHYDKALEIYPDHYDALWHRGGIYLDKGNITEALICWEKSIRLDPKAIQRVEIFNRLKLEYP